MIRDLATHPMDHAHSGRRAPRPTTIEADVLVIGAGIAGLLAATRLARAGLRVVVLESGGEHQRAETHPLNAVEQLRTPYQGAEHGRFRCLGGTSTRWGGAMLPFLASDMEGTGARNWPVGHDELLAYRPDVEALFRLPDGDYEAPDLVQMTAEGPPTFVPRLAKWPPFADRNVARLLRREIRDPMGCEVWLNATATAFHLAPGGRLAGVEARHPSGGRLTVRAPDTILAAGAIESTRLLLLADRAAGGRIAGSADVLGRYFHDHLSVICGTVMPLHRAALNRLTAFRFEQGGMRNLRFEPLATPGRAGAPVPGFAHLAIGDGASGGFTALRDLFRQVQKRRLPSGATMIGLARAAPWLARAAWWRYAERRLLYPPRAALDLHMVIEQEPRAENRITLSPHRFDVFGQPLAAIDWCVHRDDEVNLLRAVAAFEAFWEGSSLRNLGRLSLHGPDATVTKLASGGGIFHPGGTTRMAARAGEGVVDRNLGCFALPGLSVLSTSTFPSGGGANPTMMLMMAAFRLADRIAARTRQGQGRPALVWGGAA